MEALYDEYFAEQLALLREAIIDRGTHSVIDEILGEEEFKAILKSGDSHSGENRAILDNIAVFNIDAATLKLLLDHGVTVIVDGNNSSVIPPLFYAAIQGLAPIAEILIHAGADVKWCVTDEDSTDAECYQLSRGDTALHMASRCGCEEIAVLLLNSDATIDALNSRGETALHVAITAKIGSEAKLAMARCLLDHGARIDIGREPALVLAVEKKNLDMARLIIDQRKDAIEKKEYLGKGALHYAVTAGPEFVTMLIGKGMHVDDPDSRNHETPLHVAVKAGNAAMITLLLDHGADLNAKTAFNETPLYIATRNGDISTVNQLLVKGADVNAAKASGETALHAACEIGSTEMVCALLKFGADPNAAKSGRTSLDIAYVGKDSLSMVTALLKFGADPNARTSTDEDSLLDFACFAGKEEMVWTLLKFGANVTLRPASLFERLIDDEFTSNTRNMLIRHAILAAVDQPMCPRFYETFKDNPHFVNCQKEIERMKTTEFYRGLAFFKILTAREDELMRMMRNDEVREAFEAGYTVELFPLYARYINERLEKVKLMLEVRNSAEEILNTIFSTVLPCDITNKILDYFSYEDMQLLVNSVKETSVAS